MLYDHLSSQSPLTLAKLGRHPYGYRKYNKQHGLVAVLFTTENIYYKFY